MKIFPPLSEMLWPPGLSPAGLLWRRRYFLLVMISAAAGIVAWPIVQTNDVWRVAKGTPEAKGKPDAEGATQLDGSACSSLTRQSVNVGTRAQDCGSFRIRIGSSVTAEQALKRSALAANVGTLTAADRAIVRPRTLRSTVWDNSQESSQAPAIALSPTQK